MKPNQRVILTAVVAAILVVVVGWFLWGKDAMTIRNAKQVAAQALIDPSSAQFRNMQMAKYLDDVVCGEINSKNRFGAYVGFTEFVVTGDSLLLPAPPGADELTRLTWQTARGFCR